MAIGITVVAATLFLLPNYSNKDIGDNRGQRIGPSFQANIKNPHAEVATTSISTKWKDYFSNEKNKNGENKVEISDEEFNISLKQILNEIPLSQEIRQLTDEELHHTPAQLIKFARSLGEVQEVLYQNPTNLKIESSSKFYEKCINDVEAVISVRSLCFAHLKNLKTFLNDSIDLNLYPKEVIRIAEMVSDEN